MITSEALVLVVDDCADLRSGLCETLRRAGYGVVEAANGRIGLQMCRARKPALVLLDYEMPIMNGGAFLDAKQVDPAIAEVPVVMFTGSSVGEDSRVARVLTKPVAAAVVLEAIRDELGRVRSARASTVPRAAD